MVTMEGKAEDEKVPILVNHVGTECTLVHCSLYTRCIYRVLTPHELKNQVVKLQNIATNHPCWVGTRDQSLPPFEA
jgi:hypothetical protein